MSERTLPTHEEKVNIALKAKNMKADSDYYDISIATHIDTSNLVSLLDDDTILGSWEQEGIVHLYWPAQAWRMEKLKDLNQLLQRLGATPGAFTIGISRRPSENWNARWAALVKPIRIGRRIIIRPSWESLNTTPEAIEIILDPKQAFGTGHHATTHLLLEWLEEVIRGKEKVLDVGTGSGILAMVALKLGATFALGIDHDPLAIECAKAYAEINNFDEKLEFRVQDLIKLETKPFDIILANLDRRTLLTNVSYFQRAQVPGTLLLLSGILPEDRNEVTNRLIQFGWVLFDVRERAGWVALGLECHSST